MPSERPSEVKFEIGHVLFIDIVSYSKLLITEQSEQLQTLKEIVRATEQFRIAEAAGKLLRLPTGDGGALVFRNSSEAPVMCALEISKELKKHPELHVRMGIHSGPVNEVTDLNEQANIAGAGINIAQRVMDCGDAGHILVSKRIAEDLEQYPQWRSLLHELGECEVKHGVRIGVVNFYGDEIGNPEVPRQLKVFRKHRVQTRWTAIAAALLLLIGVVTAFVIVSKKSAQSISTIPEKSIAVLPFENLSGNPENAYFTDGIQEEILMRLAKIADLKVVSRTSTVRYKRSPGSLGEIATQLGVANVLEGSVQRTADRVHVNVQLINAASDAHLWAEAYDRSLTDIFAVESEIAKTIAETLQAKLSGSEQHAIAARPTENTEAHQLYLKGRYLWNRRTGENLKKSLDYFNQAITADPNYALAYVGLADCYVLLEQYAGTPSRETLPKARAAAQRALQIDDSLAEAHTSLGYVDWYSWQFGEAEKEYKRGIELNPNYPTAHHWYSIYLLSIGRTDEAMAEVKRAQQLDPLSPIIGINVGVLYLLKGDLNAATEEYKKVLELDPNFPRVHDDLGYVYLKQGREEEAIAELRKAVEVSGRASEELAYLGYGYGALGKHAEAMAVLRELQENYDRRESPATNLAAVYAGLGDKDQAFAWLEKDFQARTGLLMFITILPDYDTLRGDSRYTDLLRRMGLKPRA